VRPGPGCRPDAGGSSRPDIPSALAQPATALKSYLLAFLARNTAAANGTDFRNHQVSVTFR
jgi:hypothetical protein